MIVGIDEVGRGCWAGPLVAAAVGFADNIFIPELDDSKKLTAKKRTTLIPVIQSSTDQIGIGWVWPKEINRYGLTVSVQLAMHRALDQLTPPNNSATKIIIDGNTNYLKDLLHNKALFSKDKPLKWEESAMESEVLVGGDGLVPAISAASVVAKVARDEYMRQISKKYPQYGFDKHVGYGTKVHLEALKLYGVLSIHRVNYKPVKAILSGSV